MIPRTLLHNTKCCFTSGGQFSDDHRADKTGLDWNDGRLEVYNHLLANRLNRHFKTYDDGNYCFHRGEEAIFRVPVNEINDILSKFLSRKSKNDGQSNVAQLLSNVEAQNG